MSKNKDVGKISANVSLDAAKYLEISQEKILSVLKRHEITSTSSFKKQKFISWNLFCDIVDLIIDEVGLEKAAKTLAQFGVFGKSITTLRHFVTSFWGVHYLYKLQEQITFKMLWSCVKMEITYLSSKTVIIRKEIDEQHKSYEPFFLMYKYVYELFPAIVGCSQASVDYTSSNNVAYYHVTLAQKSISADILMRLKSMVMHLQNTRLNLIANKQVISNLIEIKNELENDNKSLSEKNQRIQKELSLKSDLLDIFSHDTNNSLTVVQNHSKKLSRHSDEDVSKRAKKIKEHGNNLAHIITYVKDFNKNLDTIESDVSISITDLIEKTLDLYQEEFSSKNIFVELDIEENFSLNINSNLFSQSVLGNILSNSIKFSNDKSKIIISAREHKSKNVISVRDFGIGMTPNEVELYNSNSTLWTRRGLRQEEGTGLGSRITRSIINRVGGDLKLYSSNVDLEDFTRGTQIDISFPQLIKSKSNRSDLLS